MRRVRIECGLLLELETISNPIQYLAKYFSFSLLFVLGREMECHTNSNTHRLHSSRSTGPKRSRRTRSNDGVILCAWCILASGNFILWNSFKRIGLKTDTLIFCLWFASEIPNCFVFVVDVDVDVDVRMFASEQPRVAQPIYNCLCISTVSK